MIYTNPHSINSSMTAQTRLCVHMLVQAISLTESYRQNSVDLLIDGGLTRINVHMQTLTHFTFMFMFHIGSIYFI